MLKKIIFIFLIILILITIIFKFSNKKPNTNSNIKENNNGQVVCTMEAKLCPDGSSVGRSGPKCEFTPCPE
ncbi:MAG TPA: hypothetical protein PK257_03595 [Candidatus Woesebacteria bacterium]|nr:hypothetical protein [Candidatus Woesebacteria bacterium]